MHTLRRSSPKGLAGKEPACKCSTANVYVHVYFLRLYIFTFKRAIYRYFLANFARIDVIMLISLAFSARGIVSNEIYQKLMFDKLEIDEGMLVENIVAQILKTAGSKLFFYNNYDKKEAENRMQIDFLIQKNAHFLLLAPDFASR